MAREKCYIAIDLKSFYASQECVARGLDPMTTNLVVADESRTEKTICLAVSPALKAWGIPGRARLFEVIQRVNEVNSRRKRNLSDQSFTGKSWDAHALSENPALEIDFIVAKPRMAHYMECSARIYEIYLKYVAPEDIHVYSIDEVFIDATPYLKTYGLGPEAFARKLIYDVLEQTGITAAAGIGTNMYLSKVALDIMAKRAQADAYGVRIASLDEQSFRRELWTHRPLTDFWRVGRGYAKKLAERGIFTMGDIARCSLENEDALYKLFGINAELLIDHAWGYEPTTIADIRAYRPESNSLGSGQVLQCPYTWEKARLVVREMTDALVMDLVDKHLVMDQIVLTVGYDRESLEDPELRQKYAARLTTDGYGRAIPKHSHGTVTLERPCASIRKITQAMMELYDRIVERDLLIRRLNVVAGRVLPEEAAQTQAVQITMFDPPGDPENGETVDRETRRQRAVLEIRKKYGKNAILKGMNYMEGATARDRNEQIGGHKA